MSPNMMLLVPGPGVLSGLFLWASDNHRDANLERAYIDRAARLYSTGQTILAEPVNDE